MGRGRSGMGGGGSYHQMSDSEASTYYAGQTITAAQQAAFDRYTDPDTEPGSLYNFSQNMNTAIAQGRRLTAAQQRVWNEINGAMHPLGQKLTLSRYDHADTVQGMLDQLGVNRNAASISADDLRTALLGVSYTDSRALSTSVNDFKNAKNAGVFTTRQFKFTYHASAKAKGVMPGMGKNSRDDFGEMLLGSSNKYKVVGVRDMGTRGRSKGMPQSVKNVNQIEIIVEVG